MEYPHWAPSFPPGGPSGRIPGSSVAAAPGGLRGAAATKVSLAQGCATRPTARRRAAAPA